MPRPKSKGGFTVPAEPDVKPKQNLKFVVKVDVGGKGTFGFPCGTGLRPVAWLIGVIQDFFVKMKDIIDPGGPDPVIEGLRDPAGVLLDPEAMLCDVLEPGSKVIPQFHVDDDDDDGSDYADAAEGSGGSNETAGQALDGEGNAKTAPPLAGAHADMDGLPDADVDTLADADVDGLHNVGAGSRAGADVDRAAAADMERLTEQMQHLRQESWYIMDSYDHAQLIQAQGHQGRVFDLCFSPATSLLLASGSEDETARLWRVSPDDSSYELVSVMQGHTDAVLRVNWSPDGRLLATGSADGTCRLWRPQAVAGAEDGLPITTTCLHTFEGHEEEVYACEFVQGTRPPQMVMASVASLFLTDLTTGQVISRTPELPVVESPSTTPRSMPERWAAGYIFCARQQPQGGHLFAASCSDGALRLYTHEGSTLRGITAMPLHSALGTSCAWHPDGYQIASVSTDGTILVLDIRTGGVVWGSKSRGSVFGCTWLPGRGSVLAACGISSAVALMDTSGGAPAGAPPAPGRRGGSRNSVLVGDGPSRMLLSIAISPGGAVLAASGDVPETVADACLDACCMPPPDNGDGGDAGGDVDAAGDPDGLFSAPVRALDGRMVFREGNATLEHVPKPKDSNIHLWRARAARLNGIA